MARVLATIVLGLTISQWLYAAFPDPPITWGEIPHDQLLMKSFPADSLASAVVLCDFGEVHFDQNFRIIFKRHRRIKILSRAGFAWGSYGIPYYAKDKTQRVRDIEGMTITVGADGNSETRELEDNSIFTEDLDNGWKRIRFTLPGLTEGCIVEYRYTVESPAYYFPDWEFQISEPTLWSELRSTVPPVFGYAVYTQGYDRYFIKESSVEKVLLPGAGGPSFAHSTLSRWVMKDLAALRAEPYITTTDDYVDKLAFQLSLVTWPGRPPEPQLESWDVVVREIYAHEHFGKQLSGFGSVTSQARTIAGGISDSLQKAIAIYDYVRRSIRWNGKRRAFVENDLDDVLEAKTGSSAEINLLLVLMLQEAGLAVHPALLSTRDNGKIYTGYPIVDQFNYVIARVVVGGTAYLIDATDPMRPFSLLPVRALNEVALSVWEGGFSWVPIVPLGRSIVGVSIRATIDSTGLIHAHCDKSFDQYAAIHEREALSEGKDDEWIKETLEVDAAGMSVDSFSVVNRDDHEKPLVASADVESAGGVQPAGEFMYMNPVIINRMTANPFKLQSREFPIDYAYPRSTEYRLTLILPEGYTATEIPRDVSMNLGGGMGTFTRHCSLDGSQFTLEQQLVVTTTVIPAGKYRLVRPFYDRIVALQNDQLVLQKKPEVQQVKPPARKKKR